MVVVFFSFFLVFLLLLGELRWPGTYKSLSHTHTYTPTHTQSLLYGPQSCGQEVMRFIIRYRCDCCWWMWSSIDRYVTTRQRQKDYDFIMMPSPLICCWNSAKGTVGWLMVLLSNVADIKIPSRNVSYSAFGYIKN